MFTKSLIRVAIIAAGVLPLGVIAHPWVAQCTVSFDDPSALTLLFDDARDTVARSTKLVPNGEHEICDTETDSACSQYIQSCGPEGSVRVEESFIPHGKYKHYHLSFENTQLTCVSAVNEYGEFPGFGIPKPNCTPDGFLETCCEAPDWKSEPRKLVSHQGDQFVRIWVQSSSDLKPKVFDLSSFRVKGTTSVELWFKKTDGKWWYWPELAPGNWDLIDHTRNVTDVYVRSANGSTQPYSIDDIVILN